MVSRTNRTHGCVITGGLYLGDGTTVVTMGRYIGQALTRTVFVGGVVGLRTVQVSVRVTRPTDVPSLGVGSRRHVVVRG